MARARSFALEHVYAEEVRKGSAVYLLCRSCFPIGRHRPSSEELESIKDPGKEYNGCIRYCWGLRKSPSHLAAHARRHCLEDSAAVRHDQLSEVGGEGGDEDTTGDFVRDMVVMDLADFASSERKGAARVYQRNLRRPLFGRQKIKAVFDEFAAAGLKKVIGIVAARKESRGKFAMPTDAWKTKGRRTRSYLAVLLHYVDKDFQLKELCAGVLPIAGRKDCAFYGEKLQHILKRVGVELSDVLTVVSDYDAPLRKAIKTVLKLPAIGCQCHGVQLPVKHVMPPKETRTSCARAAAPAPDVAAADPHACSASSSDSSSESSSSSSEESGGDDLAGVAAPSAPDPRAPCPGTPLDAVAQAEEPAAAKGPAAAQPARPRYPHLGLTDPERVKLIEELTPYAQQIRRTIKWYINNSEDYNSMQENAKLNQTDVCSFWTECPTRWDTTLLSWCSYLRNIQALILYRVKIGARVPQVMDDDDLGVVADLCTVMTPIRKGSLIMQRDGTRSSASMYLPVYHAVLRQLGPEITKLPLPDGCGQWSGPKGGDAKKNVADLAPIAKRLRDWLHADLKKMQQKHASGRK